MLTQQSQNDLTLEDIVVQVQKGDQQKLNNLLQAYQPFIAKCVSDVCKRYIDPKRDDEFSIGLSAFHDAIQTYKADRGSSFLTFAKLVISRKVIDYIRHIQKYPTAISLDETYDEEYMENPLEIAAVKEQYQVEQDVWYCRQEILEFKEKLADFQLSLEELVEVSPKHRDARESAIRIARIISNDKSLSDYVKYKKKLPIKDLIKKVDVSKKTLERNRKYILAMFIVLNEKKFVYLRDYLKGVGL